MRHDHDDSSRYRRGTPDLRDRRRGGKAGRICDFQNSTDDADRHLNVRMNTVGEHAYLAQRRPLLRLYFLVRRSCVKNDG